MTEAPDQQQEASAEVRRRVQDSFDRQGLMAHLGARITGITPGRVHIVLGAREEVSQQHGYIHAGATSAVADTAGGYAALTLFPDDCDVLTVEYKINLLSPAVGDRIEAIGTVVKSGRTLTVCRLEVYALRDGAGRTLVAHGQQTLIRVNTSAQ
ncbi:PaaI family thioesterase [Streptomyces sp. NPDC051018]|uniref:PaaI family thioesterase n=1 Tax=Streptomyces sp. NPDC051018 TaxID=3365639 RepID=UPI0037B64887